MSRLVLHLTGDCHAGNGLKKAKWKRHVQQIGKALSQLATGGKMDNGKSERKKLQNEWLSTINCLYLSILYTNS